MPKTANVFQVLRLFSQDRRFLRAADVAALLDVSSATAYRYVADLEEAGMIEAAGAGRYVLGPTIVELDRQIRVHDPLIAAAADVMKSLAERTGGTIILTRLHGLKVVCVDQVRGRHGPKTVSYERGRAMPLYRGATSTAILAHLDEETLRELAASDATALRRAGLPTRTDALLDHLARIRDQGVAHTESAVDADTLGWGVPLLQGRHLLGSLSVVLSRQAPDVAPRHIADQLHRAALRLLGRLEAETERAAPSPSRHNEPLPARPPA